MNINIIGAGPIGSYTAYLLSKKGHQVNLFEEHAEIGKPVQCTGLVTPTIKDYLPKTNQFIINQTKKILLQSPHNQAVINKKEFILDRAQLDNFLAQKAQDSGTQLYTYHQLIKKDKTHLIFKHKNKTKKIKQEITIGADGPLSKTAKIFNFPNQNKFYYGYQARIKGHFNPDQYQVNFNNNVAPKFFSWLVPEDQITARIGLATPTPSNQQFQNLIKPHKKNIINLQAGLIPVYNPKIKTQHQNTLLIGDAATQVKATTGGGLIPGLKAAQQLAKAISNNQNYPKLWQKALHPSLKKHLLIRNALNKFSNQDYDFLIKSINTKNFKNYNREHLNFTNLTKILIKNPRLIYFTKHLF